MQDNLAATGGACLFFLADLHAITVRNDPAELRANTRNMAAALLAPGIDPAKSILFNQARVPAHAELAWLPNCTARLGWLNRSEAPPSELQSLMRITYAVFCLPTQHAT